MRVLPFPRMEWTHLALNPTAKAVVIMVPPQNYRLDDNGLEWFCPYCHVDMTYRAPTAAIKWFGLKSLVYVKVCDCENCHNHSFRISFHDLLKHVEVKYRG